MKIVDKLRKLLGKEKPKKPVVSAVIVAAGSSKRMGGTDKLTAPVNGVPVLVRTLQAFENCAVIDEIVVVVRQGDEEKTRLLCAQSGISKCAAVVTGGSERVDSVYAGVMNTSPDAAVIAVHDGARPLVTDEIITSVIKTAQEHTAAVAAVPATDTLKQVENGVIVSTIDRSTVYAMQTPQAFDADLLRGAIQNAVSSGLSVTDDCMAVEAMGVKPYIVAGSPENIKITTPVDLVIAESVLSGRAQK